MSLGTRITVAAAMWLIINHLQGTSPDALVFAVLVGAVVLGTYLIDVIFWASREFVVLAKERIA